MDRYGIPIAHNNNSSSGDQTDRYGIPIVHNDSGTSVSGEQAPSRYPRRASADAAIPTPQAVDRYGIPIAQTHTQNNTSVDQQPRRASADGATRRTSSVMTEEEQKKRRASIKKIMSDSTLTPVERRWSIQGLMDGRLKPSEDSKPSSRASFSSRDSGSRDRNPASMRSNGDHNMAEAQIQQERAVALAMSTRMEQNRPPCTHYERNCTIVSPCCGIAFGCRICHDECPNLPPALLTEQQHTEQQTRMRRYQRHSSLPSSFTSMPDQSTHHNIDRFAVKEIICRNCFTRQSSKTNNCINCHLTFGEYHCSICNLWMSAAESPYHCDGCGFCRVGGQENFRHCDDCGMCIDVLLFNGHDCNVGKYMANCPVCQEDLFSSRSASHEMPCGHAIHWHCFRQLASYDSRCPICKKTAETPERMASVWSAMAMGITLQPVPHEMAKVVDISCIDCEHVDERRRWHFLGVQCKNCSSFNTTVDRIVMTGPEASSFLREHGDGRIIAPPPQNAQASQEAPGRYGSYEPYDLDSDEDMEDA